MVDKVTSPAKMVTDALVLKRLAEQGIDKNYVEFWHDYAPRSRGKEYSPYAKFYRDLKSNKRFMVVSGLPMVKPNGQKIEIGWRKQGSKYVTKPNLFSAVVEGTKITVTCLNDQPDDRKEGDTVTWKPQLYLNNVEQTSGGVVLLPIDPINPDLQNDTLEWDYGICNRRIRAIQGRLREKWVFFSNPNGEVRIKHNHSGLLKLRFGDYEINDDEEIIPTTAFNQVEYPLEIGASPETFYPASGANSPVDGYVRHTDSGGLTFHNIVIAAGISSGDSGNFFDIMQLNADNLNNKWDGMIRGIFLFDTSALPDAAVISGAVFSIRGEGKGDQLSVTPDINVYSSAPANNNALVAGDFNSLGTVALSSVIAYGDWNISGYNDFTLIDVNTDDFGYIGQGTGEAGMTKLGTRNANYEVADALDPNNHDPNWGSQQVSDVGGYFADNGSNKPKLVVTYSLPSIAVPGGSPLAALIDAGII